MFITEQQLEKLINFYRDEHKWKKAMELVRFRVRNKGRIFPYHIPEKLL